MNAIYESLTSNKNSGDPIFVEKTPSNEEYAKELRNWFPGSTFFHVLRNPYANIYSKRKGEKRPHSLRKRVYRPTAKSLYFMERNDRYLEEHYIVKYEDLVSKTEKTMRWVAKCIGVDFDDILLRPTILGEPWGGNSRSVDESFEGIDRRPLTVWKENISDLDVALVNRYFSEFMKKRKYELRPSSSTKWLPLKWEMPHNYIRNRFLLSDDIL